MFKHMRWAAPMVVVVFSLTALAGAAGGPSTSQPTATFNVQENVLKHKEKDCTGTDGAYRDVKAEYQGTITSGDEPRLNGQLTIRGDALVNADEGSGITHGKFEVRDPATNAKTFEGDFDATNSSLAGGVLKGLIAGNFPGSGGDRLVANFTAEFESDGTTVDGELGQQDVVGDSSATQSGQDPAVIQQGHC